ncbi:regulator of G-protein signaling 22 [Kryptolebias marmoratus]|uniref:regulator of G-protein signaling 22 n=1 Tax=Kryptolebias marmoratus TaxID=37003 RepID=UPI0018AC9282|nr:regulator of G-protein signaling 22 [Kryptolebias marmoratus]
MGLPGLAGNAVQAFTCLIIQCADSFQQESSLASDNVLAHFFNDFLSLPSFSEILLYNQDTGQFEVVNGAAHFVSRKISTALNRSKSQILRGDLTVLMRTPPADNSYTVCCLDREQGLQWLRRERLTFFLQSDYYYQYRLAKLLLQWDQNVRCQRGKSSSSLTTFSASKLQNFPQLFQGNVNALCRSHSQESISAKQGVSSHHKYEKTQKLHSSQRNFTLSADVRENEYLRDSVCETYDSPEKHFEYLAFKVVNQVIRAAVIVVHGLSQAHTSHRVTNFGRQTNCSSTNEGKKCTIWKALGDEDGETFDERKEKHQDGLRGSRRTEKTEWDEKTWTMGSKFTNQENGLDVFWHGSCWVCKRPGFDEFQEFLQGTSGENLLNLWMDIERLKATQHSERKNRYLVLMRSWYLVSSSPSRLNRELLSTLGLTTSLCWTEEKLRSVQPCITESLLCYWGPRFWSSQCVQDVSPCVGLWTGESMSRRQPCHGCAPLSYPHPHTSLSQSSHASCAQLLSSRRQLLCGGRTEKMVQALSVESQSGLYFTHFCEQSGNQLWVDAVYFWTDLLHYHELFCQDGPDPYRVQREAQLLYSTYIFSSARRSINVDVGIQREVYDRLRPAFEELFDDVEEHALSILLEPWTLLISRDKESLQQVCLQEEVRCIDSQEYRELQNLYKESERQLRQSGSKLLASTLKPWTDSSESPQLRESWSSVSPVYQGYRLGSLLRQPYEIGHFMSFLQKQDASMHLMCWLDLEQYRRTSQKDETSSDIRQERSSYIAAKYLNKKYFFGSDSPATAEQQNDILRRAGGLERLKLECLSDPVVMEIQDIIRMHMEETWLPLFLSTKEFTERQKHKQKLQTADRLSQHVYCRRRARREAWKVRGSWMNSSTEIMLFRRVLLNPTTCQQFQHFVSLKGDFLENDVRFWVEVQKYKDLCHSHSDEATIHQKISTIISCFINSSMPPSLQIDIPPNQAQLILEKRHKLGPYIFREAQVSVFSELLRFWPEFQEFRSMVQEEQLLPLLQKKRVKHKTREQRQRRKEEEERREELERESCCREEEDEDDKEQKETSETQSRTQSRMPVTPPQSLLWSYSKYMAGLKREEMLLRRQSQLGTSFSTTSDFSTDCSFKSASSKHGSSRTDSKQMTRSNSSRNHESPQHEMRVKCIN